MIRQTPRANDSEQDLHLSSAVNLPSQVLRQNFEQLKDPRLECISREISNESNQGHLFQIGYSLSELTNGSFLWGLRFGILSWVDGKNELIFTRPDGHDATTTIEVPYDKTVSQAVEAAVCNFAFKITDWLHGKEIRHAAAIVSSAFSEMSPEQAGFIVKPIDRLHATHAVISGKVDFSVHLGKLNLSREELADTFVDALQSYHPSARFTQTIEKFGLTPDDIRAAAERTGINIEKFSLT